MNKPTMNFKAAHQVLEKSVENKLLSGVSALVLKDGVAIDRICIGKADLESGAQLREDHLFRAFSNTKLITSSLALKLFDEGHFALDDPIKRWIPEFGNTRVLRPRASAISDTEALTSDITIRHLLSHQAGLSHGVFDPGTVIYQAYQDSGVRKPDTTLAQLMPMLAALPLVFQPGNGWEYSMATDVLARFIEILTGQSFPEALRTRLFEPLGLTDTGHVIRADQALRLAPLYRGPDDLQPTLPGLTRMDNVPWPDAFVKPKPRFAGTSGLVTSLADYAALLNNLLGGKFLKPSTLVEMMRDQVPAKYCVIVSGSEPYREIGFGLGGAVTRRTSSLQPNSPTDEFQWGGLGGTHWCMSQSTGIAIVLMTQRYFGFWNPFWFEYKQKVYEACGVGA